MVLLNIWCCDCHIIHDVRNEDKWYIEILQNLIHNSITAHTTTESFFFHEIRKACEEILKNMKHAVTTGSFS